jgi:hypothetical protein
MGDVDDESQPASMASPIAVTITKAVRIAISTTLTARYPLRVPTREGPGHRRGVTTVSLRPAEMHRDSRLLEPAHGHPEPHFSRRSEVDRGSGWRIIIRVSGVRVPPPLSLYSSHEWWVWGRHWFGGANRSHQLAASTTERSSIPDDLSTAREEMPHSAPHGLTHECAVLVAILKLFRPQIPALTEVADGEVSVFAG